MTHLPRLTGALTLCASLGTWAPSAMALNPETTARIESARFVNLSNIASLSSANDTTAYMGLEQCRQAATNNTPIQIEFKTTFDINTTMTSSALKLDALYVFENSKGSNTSVDCTVANTCNKVGDDNYTISGRSVTTNTGLTFADLTNIRSQGECNEKDQEYFVRISIAEDTRRVNADLRLVVDSIPPGEPDSFSALLTENRASLTWEDTEVTDVEDYVVVFSNEQIPQGATLDQVSKLPGFLKATLNKGTSNSGQVSVSLPPGADIWVGLLARDLAKNSSKVITNAAPVTVLDTTDFWEQYRRAGGDEEGGYCQSVPAHSPARSPLPLLLLALVAGPGYRRLRTCASSLRTRHSR